MSDYGNNDDAQLVQKLLNNELKAFDLLFYKYKDKLFRFAFSLLKNEEDAREIVQEVFIRIWDKRMEIDSGKSFKSFLFRISYNLIIDELKQRIKDEKFQKFLVSYFKSDTYSLDEQLDYDILVKKVRAAVEGLPPKRKQIYILSREVGLSNQEIAQRMGITKKTVENQINLALKHIKSCLGKDFLVVILFISLFA